MKKLNRLLFALLWMPVLAVADPFSELYYYRAVEPGPIKILECDLAVYGGTPAGVATAIQAAKMGKKVMFFSFNHFTPLFNKKCICIIPLSFLLFLVKRKEKSFS